MQKINLQIKRAGGLKNRLSVADVREVRVIIEPNGFDRADFNEVYARQFVERLEFGAHDNLQAGGRLHLDDRKILEIALKKLRPEFDALTGILEPMRASDPNSLRAAYANLQQIMEKCFDLGAVGVLPVSGKKQMDNARAAHAREEGRKKVVTKQEELQTVVYQVLKELKRKMSVSKECVNQIRPHLLAKLGLPDDAKGYPGVDAIKDAIRALKNRRVS
jgi:hypothetical protein